MSNLVKINPVYGQLSPTGLIEKAVILLLENGINKVRPKQKNDISIFSVLYIFSNERIATALSNLVNNEIINIDYENNRADFTLIFKSFKKLIYDKCVLLNTVYEDNAIISKFSEKLELIKSVDLKNDYSLILHYINLRINI